MLAKIDWESWVTQPGYPPVEKKWGNHETDAAEKLALSYIELKGRSSPIGF